MTFFWIGRSSFLSFSWFSIGYWVVPKICKPKLEIMYLFIGKCNRFNRWGQSTRFHKAWLQSAFRKLSFMFGLCSFVAFEYLDRFINKNYNLDFINLQLSLYLAWFDLALIYKWQNYLIRNSIIINARFWLLDMPIWSEAAKGQLTPKKGRILPLLFTIKNHHQSLTL